MDKNKILIIDDDKTILRILKDKCESQLKAEVITATTYKEAIKIILQNKAAIKVAVVDLNLPDATNGQLADYTLAKNIPTIVLTGMFDNDIKERLLYNDVLDYIQKDSQKSLSNAIKAVDRVLKNYETTILLVDDSKIQRELLKNLLISLKLNVLTAQNGKEALDIINDKTHNISLLLTDYNMPVMDGMELTLAVRELYDKDELGIIVLSSNENEDIATTFIRIGANDYIDKPFKKTAVTTRVHSVLHILDLFRKTKELTYKDFMTGAYNRRYFYDSGVAIFEKAERENKDVAIATIDIDKFKSINDNYGHDMGDICIIKVVELLHSSLRSSDLVARFGGEEFIVLLDNIDIKNVTILFEKIRKSFEDLVITTNQNTIKFTVSIGICFGKAHTINDMIKISDEALYFCKENGRNQIKILQEEL
jgi:diguanylate cyclase (GGDEF)-like protein